MISQSDSLTDNNDDDDDDDDDETTGLSTSHVAMPASQPFPCHQCLQRFMHVTTRSLS